MTTVYFVRHAKPDKSIRDDRTRPLTDEGLADSEKVTELLKDKGIDLLMSSPYKRSMDTIGSLAKALNMDIVTDEDFREREAGDWQGDNFLKFIEAQWADFNYHIMNGECLASVQERNIRALKRVLNEHEGKTVVIATHGTALSTIINFYKPEYDFHSFMRILDFMPYVVKMEFDGEKFLGMSEELIVEKIYKI
ncbi:MAG: histidine phosphatase family protein [Oscillospiraceae bacterium]